MLRSFLDPHLRVLGQLCRQVAVVRGHGLTSAHLPGAGEAQGGDGGGPGGQGGEGRGEAGRHGGLGEHVVGDGGPRLAPGGRVDVSGGPAGDDGRDPGVSTGQATSSTTALVLQGGDLVEDVSQGLVLRAPVKEVVPVIAAGYLLLAVHNAGTLYLA